MSLRLHNNSSFELSLGEHGHTNMNRIFQFTVAFVSVSWFFACVCSGAENERVVSDALSVELRRYPEKKSIYNRNPVMVRFTNRGKRAISIFKPLDGSFWSWHMPYYRITVIDAQRKELKMRSRCGNSGLWASTNWPDDYIVTIAPGKSYELEVGIHHVIPSDGDYRVTFEYAYDPTDKQQQTFPMPPGAWTGMVRSKENSLPLKKLQYAR